MNCGTLENNYIGIGEGQSLEEEGEGKEEGEGWRREGGGEGGDGRRKGGGATVFCTHLCQILEIKYSYVKGWRLKRKHVETSNSCHIIHVTMQLCYVL